MTENAFETVIQKELNRKIIETLYEYPYSTNITLSIRMMNLKKYPDKSSKRYKTELKKTRDQITKCLNKIKPFNYFVDDGFGILYPANMFPTGYNQEWMFYSRVYIGMNSISKTTNFPDTPETILETFNKRWFGWEEIVELCKISRNAAMTGTGDLVDADILERKHKEVTLNNDYLKQISEWHERKSTPLVEKDEETSIFVKELRKWIGNTSKITAKEKKGIKYYKVEADGESVELCSNPMGRYLSWI